MKVDGAPYEVMKTRSGYHVMRRTQRRAVPGGAPVVLSVAGPYRTEGEALSAAISLASSAKQAVS